MEGMQALNIDPVLVSLGPLQVRWYGLMYVLSFLVAGQILKKLSRDGYFRVTPEKADVFLTYMLIGMFLGARFFYVLFYNLDFYLQNPGDIIAIWKGGLSFHGALFGMCFSLYFFARKNKLHYLEVADCLALCGSQGLFWGRIGNFINGELYGRVTTSPLGMVFKHGGPQPRHPSQLYEAIFEGLVLTLCVWMGKKHFKHHGAASGIFLMGYAFFRFFIEFFREADAQVGYFLGGNITMGQILCFVMFLAGLAYFIITKKKNLLVGKVKVR